MCGICGELRFDGGQPDHDTLTGMMAHLERQPRCTGSARPRGADKLDMADWHLRRGELCRPLVDFLAPAGERVVEIGPGSGVLGPSRANPAWGSHELIDGASFCWVTGNARNEASPTSSITSMINPIRFIFFSYSSE